MKPRYWTADRGTAEVDFVVQCGNNAFPVEAKAGRNLKARSLSVYRELFSPSRLYRASLEQYHPDGPVRDFPLYALSNLVADMKEDSQ